MRPSSSTKHLRIDRKTVYRVEGLAQSFVERGMRVDGLHHHLHGGFGFHGGDGFTDQLESLRPDDVDAQNLSVLLVGHYLDEAFVMSKNRRAAIAREREAPDLHLVTLRASLRFRKPHAADAGFGVGAARDAVPVD